MGTNVDEAEGADTTSGWAYHLDDPLGRYTHRPLNAPTCL